MFKTPNVGFVDILGQVIMVEIDDAECIKLDAVGLYSNEKIILKSYYANKKDFIRVLYHEAFHALCESLGCQLDIHIEETLAHRVSILYSEMNEDY